MPVSWGFSGCAAGALCVDQTQLHAFFQSLIDGSILSDNTNGNRTGACGESKHDGGSSC
jgi:hypothetical protein